MNRVESVKSVKNPFRKDDELDVVYDKLFVDVLGDRLMGKGGLMFKLFDLGNLGLDKEKVLVFKNKIGAEVRKFWRSTPTRGDFERNVEEFELVLGDIGKLCFGGNSIAYEGYLGDVKRLLTEFVAEIISCYNAKVMEKKGGLK